MSDDARDDSPMSLTEIADDLRDDGFGDRVEVEEVLEAFGRRSYGPLLLIPALISVTPVIGALPGVTWVMSALVLLISLQFVLMRKKLWLPRPLREASMSHETLNKSLDKVQPWLERMDKVFKPRLEILLNPASTWLIALVCVVLGVAMFAFSIVPGGIMIPGVAVLLLAIGLTTHDGFVLLLGLAAAAANIGAVWWLLL